MKPAALISKILATGAIAFSLLPFAARLYWWFELTTHFRVQYFVACVLLLVVFAAQRKPRWCAALAGCAIINAVAIRHYVPLPWHAAASAAAAAEAAEPDAAHALKVLSANVWYRNRSADRLLGLVRAESPDLVLLVEFTPRAERAVEELRAKYPYRIESPAEGAAGIALYSRFPLEGAEAFELGSRAALEARVQTPDGVFALIGVHLRSPTSRYFARLRNRELTLLAQRVNDAGRPVVVAGDFNVTPFSPYYTEWLDATKLTDTRYDRNLTPSWPAFLPIIAIPIDHCAVSDEFRIISQRRLPAFGSDHYAILAELALRREANPQ